MVRSANEGPQNIIVSPWPRDQESLPQSQVEISILPSGLYCIALQMASHFPVVHCRTGLPSSSSAAQPSISLFSPRTHAAISHTGQVRRKGEHAKSARSSVRIVALRNEDNCTQGSAQLAIDSQNVRSLIKTLGGLVCGVCTAASIIAWDLPALADDLPPPPDSSAVATPYARSSDGMKIGLAKGRIQACPLDINPNCVSTSSNNGGYAAPWIIPESSTANAAKKIETAILSTQKNPAILQVEDIPGGGTYLAAEADGLLGRDVMEFLVKEDVVTYRSMARKVVYFYPFQTPIGDFDGQQRRLKALEEELGWSIPSFENTYYDEEGDGYSDY